MNSNAQNQTSTDKPTKPLVKKATQIQQYLTSSFVIIIITLIFFFAGYFNYALSQLKTVLLTKVDYVNKLNYLHKIKFILLVCLFPIIYGVVLLYFKNVFENIKFLELFLGFLIYFSFIVIVPSIIFIFIPSFVEIFENTIGFALISIYYKSVIENVMKNFKSKYFATTNNNDTNPFYSINRSFLLKLFNLENMHNTVDEFKKFKDNNDCDFYIDIDTIIPSSINGGDGGEPTVTSQPLLEPLLELILAKNTIGYTCWGVLASCMAFILTVNSNSINYSNVGI